jgi:hypothetical protein
MVAVKGYFKGDNFVNETGIAIPDGRPVIVTILEEEARPEASHYAECQRQKQLFQDFFKAWDEVEDEPLTAAFDEAITKGLHFREPEDI